MENPATWNRATKVISDALSESLLQQHRGVIGYSPARIIHDALEKEGLLISDPVASPVTLSGENDDPAVGNGWPQGWCSSCDRMTSRGCVISQRPACDVCGDWLLFSGVHMPVAVTLSKGQDTQEKK